MRLISNQEPQSSGQVIKMRKIMMMSAVCLLALAGSANAATKHTWYQLNYDTATCELSSRTPEEFQSFVSGFGHLTGVRAE